MRIALDTNALVRLLIVDDRKQSTAVQKLAETHQILLLRTVLMESEWLLRGRFGIERAVIQAFFNGLADTENFELEDEAQTREALAAYSAGMDFADAMHMASAGTTPLHTFDEKFAKRAAKRGASVKRIKA